MNTLTNFWSIIRDNLRIKVALSIVFPLTIILVAFNIIEYVQHKASMLDSLSLLAAYSGNVIDSSLHHAMQQSDFDEVQALLDTLQDSGEFQNIYILNTTGEIIFAPYEKDIGVQMSQYSESCQPCHEKSAEDRPSSITLMLDSQEQVFRSMQPIENRRSCLECHESDDHLLGLLLIDIPLSTVSKELRDDLGSNVLWAVATITITIIVVHIVLSSKVTNRLRVITNAMAGLGSGQVGGPLQQDSNDEIGQVASTFNHMKAQIIKRDEENKSLTENLQERNVQKGQLLNKLINAQEAERKRVARELHDELGKCLSGLSIQTEILDRYLHINDVSGDDDAIRAQQQLDQIRSLLKETSEQTYNIILGLRPSVLDDLGLVSALREYTNRLNKQADIDFQIEASGLEQRLPADLETMFYRIFQEAISNIVKHAKATSVQLKLHSTDKEFVGEIYDDGIGFDLNSVDLTGNKPRGLGLLGMQERIAHCCGKMDIITSVGQGTRIVFNVPFETDNNRGKPCE